MNYTTYLFDFDYTLADSSRGIVTCFRNVLTRHGYTEVTDDDIKRTIGKTLEDSFSILTGVTDAGQLAGFKAEYRKEADTHMTVNTVLFLETKSVLTALKDSAPALESSRPNTDSASRNSSTSIFLKILWTSSWVVKT